MKRLVIFVFVVLSLLLIICFVAAIVQNNNKIKEPVNNAEISIESESTELSENSATDSSTDANVEFNTEDVTDSQEESITKESSEETETEVDSKTETESYTETSTESKSDTDTETETAPITKTDTESQTETDTINVEETNFETTITAENDTDSETETTLDSTVHHIESANGLEFVLDTSKEFYILVGIGECVEKDIVVDTYNGLPVKRVEDNAFYFCSDIVSIKLSENVVSIGNNAFSNCENLERIDISAVTVGDMSFLNCANLYEIIISDKIENVGFYAFSGCEKIENVYYNGNLSKWSEIAFADEEANPLSYAKNGYVKENSKEYVLISEILPNTEITEIT